MPLAKYLPSAQFSLIAGALLLSGGLIYAAGHLTADRREPATVASVAEPEADWQAELEAIQATAPRAPAAPDGSVVEELRQSVKSSNLTQSLGKTLFINLTDASAQGLGGDIPTQDRLVAEATRELAAQRGGAAYSINNLSSVAQTKDSLHAYGNAVIQALTAHPAASAAQTLVAVGYATDYQDQKALDALSAAHESYAALTDDLAAIAVPEGLLPLHLQLLNDLAAMTAVFPDMQSVLKDPLRGLAGLQAFQSKSGEAQRVLTSIAQFLNKNAILFKKGEAGSSWSVFISP